MAIQKCERCPVQLTGFNLPDYCATCGKNLCAKCMARGCCGKVPAASGMATDDGDDPDDITVEFGDAEEIDLRVDNRVHALQVPRIGGRNPDTLKINRRTGECRWFQQGNLAVRSVIPRELSVLLLAKLVSPRTTDWFGLPLRMDRTPEVAAWVEIGRAWGGTRQAGRRA